MKKISLFLFIIGIVYILPSTAQEGFIRGTVYDNTTGEYLPGVTIYLEKTSQGVITDLDGKFSISANPGGYTMRISYISYETLILEDVVVDPAATTDLGEIKLMESSIELSEVVITSKAIRNTESALISIKKRSPNILDGISAGTLKMSGDSDAADAIKRVTGVSVSQGKYVFVRGLGDRYTKTMLSGMDVPGLDPDRNSLQMDIFPTNVIDNIIVHKTFSADLPADFTGGAVNIELKDFPNQKETGISIGLGYNPDMQFKSDYLSYKGGATDFLGFDDGTRAIPATEDIPRFAEVVGNPDGEKGRRYRDILNDFTPIMATKQQMSLPNFSMGIAHGNQRPLNQYTLGYHFSLSYKNNTQYFTGTENGKYGLTAGTAVYEMERREYQTGNYGVNDVLMSGLAGVAIKSVDSKIRLNIMHLQNGKSTAGIFDFVGSDQGSNFIALQHGLDYSERSLTNLLLDGKHRIRDGLWELTWKLSPTYSKLYDPDIRFTRYEITGEDAYTGEDTYRIGTEVGFPERIWRNLNEINSTGLVNAERKLNVLGMESTLNFGGLFTYKQRNYIIRNFSINPRGNYPLSGNPDELFYEENLWLVDGQVGVGTTYETPFIPNNPNRFEASVFNSAGYLSGEFSMTGNLKLIAGLRVENFIQFYTGSDQQRSNVLDHEMVLNNTKLFPSVNLVYNFLENQNLRISYTQTVARPSFKELSYAEIYDPITGNTFIGGFHRDADDINDIEYWDGNLQSTDIQNFDFRWELFPSHGQLVSLSAFYKTFDRPIEMVQFTKQIGAFQPRNVGNGEVYGVELETRKNLAFITESLTALRISANVTYTQSSISLSETEYQSRIENAKTGQHIGETRVMAGQAPYMINTGISYNGGNKRFSEDLRFGLFYNVQGKTLEYVGVADRPDIYSNPFHSLNLNLGYIFGENDLWRAEFRINNLLDEPLEMVYSSFGAADQYFEKRNPGRTISIRLSHRITGD